MSSSLKSKESVCSAQRGSRLLVPVIWGLSLARGPFLIKQCLPHFGKDHAKTRDSFQGLSEFVKKGPRPGMVSHMR